LLEHHSGHQVTHPIEKPAFAAPIDGGEEFLGLSLKPLARQLVADF
jgi:hypothetical protein